MDFGVVLRSSQRSVSRKVEHKGRRTLRVLLSRLSEIWRETLSKIHSVPEKWPTCATGHFHGIEESGISGPVNVQSVAAWSGVVSLPSCWTAGAGHRR